MIRAAAVIGCVAAAAAIAAGAAISADPTVTGTWVGRSGFIGDSMSKDRLAELTVVVRPARLDLTSYGPTAASHDSPSLKGTCVTHYALDRVAGGWSYYRQVGRGLVRNGGGPETGPCWGSRVPAPWSSACVARE